MSKTRFFGNLIKTNPTLPTANSGANYGTATGVWTLEEAGAFRASGDWPIPASVPGAPSITSVTSGDEQVIVAFSGNADTGGLDPTSFTALASSGQSASGSSSPLTVTGLTNDTAITFTVTATNVVGTSSASSASSSVTPAEPINGFFITGTNGGTRKAQVDRVSIPTTGNATDYQDLIASYRGTAAGNATRTLHHWGITTSTFYGNSGVYYFSPVTAGTNSSFGNLTAGGNARTDGSALANNTRFVHGGGTYQNEKHDDMSYFTIASTGNSTNFGTLNKNDKDGSACASTTRGIFYHDYGGGADTNIDYITIASTGAASDFGDLTESRSSHGALSNATRGVMFGGRTGGSQYRNTIEYITIANTGNATDFGDLQQAKWRVEGTASSTRGVMGGGASAGANDLDEIGYITIGSTGNAQDFGNLALARMEHSAAGNAHGGIS